MCRYNCERNSTPLTYISIMCIQYLKTGKIGINIYIFKLYRVTTTYFRENSGKVSQPCTYICNYRMRISMQKYTEQLTIIIIIICPISKIRENA